MVELARQAKATKGRKLRLDATCVQTTIQHPTDSGLLVDSVRVLSRLVTRYALLEQPHEHGQALEAVQHHRQVFGRPPRLVAGDRGVHSADTEEVLTSAGVK